MEAVLISDVSTSWTTVNLDNTYSNAIPVCTYVLGTFAGSNPNYTNLPAVPRIQNITSNSFQLKIQGWENSAASTNDVHCLIVESGAHTMSDGRKLEAHSVLSNATNGQFTTDGGWDVGLLENVSSSIVHTYTAPVVLGQVISYNDARASVIYVNDCDNRANHPFQSGQSDGICVGKHIGAISGTRSAETIGYIVAESGSGTVNNVFYQLALGSDSVAGNRGSNVGYNYAMAASHNIAVLTQAAEDGGNGSWAVLYGTDPLSGNNLQLAVDEEIFEGDTSRNHTNERVYYWGFTGAEITLVKNVINDDDRTATSDDFILSATGPDTISGITGAYEVTKRVVHPGTYTLSETTLPGYTAGAWSCTGANSFSGTTFTVTAGQHAICTITNDDEIFSSLTLVKQVVNSDAGTAAEADFELSFTGSSSGTGISGSAAVTAVEVAPGNYTLSESNLPGYQLSDISCDGADANGMDGLDIALGEKVTCVFINDDQTVDLQVVKSVSDDSPNVGASITFSLIVSNLGPDLATNVTVTDVLPAGLSYVSFSISGGDSADDSDPDGAGLSWTIASLASNTSTTLTYTVSVLAP